MSAAALTEPCCPVCRARIRVAECGRCGADLRPLLLIAARAGQLRAEALQALAHGHARLAAHLASSALELHDTPQCRRVAALCKWMASRAL